MNIKRIRKIFFGIVFLIALFLLSIPLLSENIAKKQSIEAVKQLRGLLPIFEEVMLNKKKSTALNVENFEWPPSKINQIEFGSIDSEIFIIGTIGDKAHSDLVNVKIIF